MTDTEKPCVFPSLGRPEGTGCIAYHLAALPMDKAIWVHSKTLNGQCVHGTM